MFSQGNWQRAWASESDEALKKGAWLAAGLVLPLVFVMGFLGTVVAGQGAVSEPSAAFFYLIEDAGVIFVAAFIVLAVALACSSIDTLQNAIVASFSRDLSDGSMDIATSRIATIAMIPVAIYLATGPTILGLNFGDAYSVFGIFLFADILAGCSMTTSDDDISPIVVSLMGTDCATFASTNKLDHRRLVAIDTTGDLSERVTLMTSPGSDLENLDAVAGLICNNGRKVTAIKDSPGFISQRIRAMIGNLGCEMANIQLASPEDIDLAMRLGLNYPMGPLEIIDDLGVKNAFDIMQTMQEITGDDRYRPSPWLRRRALLGLSAYTPV